MKSNEFIIWLDGFSSAISDTYGPTFEQWQLILEKMKDVQTSYPSIPSDNKWGYGHPEDLFVYKD